MHERRWCWVKFRVTEMTRVAVKQEKPERYCWRDLFTSQCSYREQSKSRWNTVIPATIQRVQTSFGELFRLEGSAAIKSLWIRIEFNITKTKREKSSNKGRSPSLGQQARRLLFQFHQRELRQTLAINTPLHQQSGGVDYISHLQL